MNRHVLLVVLAMLLPVDVITRAWNQGVVNLKAIKEIFD